MIAARGVTGQLPPARLGSSLRAGFPALTLDLVDVYGVDIIGDFSNLIGGISAERTEFDAHIRHVNNLLGHINAPPPLRSKVLDFFEFKYALKEGKTAEVMDELPSALRFQMISHRYGTLLKKIHVFADLEEETLVELGEQIRTINVSPGDTIIEEGQRGQTLYILQKGVAEASGEEIDEGQVSKP